MNTQLAGQIGWLLPLALLGLVAAGWQTPLRAPSSDASGAYRSWLPSRQHQALLLWGMWLLTQAVFFSVANFWHRYYLVMLTPAIAALAGAGVVALWQDYRRPGWKAYLLPSALVGMAAVQVYILRDYAFWSRWLAPLIVGLSVVAAAGLLLGRFIDRLRRHSRSRIVATIGVLALLIAPATWAAIPVFTAPGDMLPAGGPNPLGPMMGGFVGPGGPGAPQDGAAGGQPGQPGAMHGWRPDRPAGGMAGGPARFPPRPRFAGQEGVDQKLLSYLLANRGDARFLVATPAAHSASPIIIATGQPVMALGGFGGDRILTAEQLQKLVADGTIRFFLMPPRIEDLPTGARPIRAGVLAGGTGDAEQWVFEHCRPVPRELWQTTPSPTDESLGGAASGASMFGMGEELYDCGAGSRQP